MVPLQGGRLQCRAAQPVHQGPALGGVASPWCLSGRPGLCWTPRPMLDVPRAYGGHPSPWWTLWGHARHPGLHQTSPDTHWLPKCCFLSPRKCTKAPAFSQSLYKTHTFTEASTLQGGMSLGCGASQDGALALLHPRVVLHQVGVQEGVLGNPFLDPLEEPVGGEGG